MKKIILCLFSLLFLASCTTKQDEPVAEKIRIEVPVTEEKITSPEPPKELSVNDVKIKLNTDSYLQKGDKLKSSEIIPPTDTFNTMTPIKFDSIKGWKVIHVVPSIDTPVCSIQTRQLDTAVDEFNNVTFMTISADLPFALMRFKQINTINDMTLYSDYQGNSFAKENKLFMPEYDLATRAIIVVDEHDTVQYIEYAPEVTKELNLHDAINFVRQNK